VNFQRAGLFGAVSTTALEAGGGHGWAAAQTTFFDRKLSRDARTGEPVSLYESVTYGKYMEF
jgi:hypothetical protein